MFFRFLPGYTDHISVSHALALLLASIIESLSLTVSGVLKEASLERGTNGLEKDRLFSIRIRAEHHGAAIILGIWTKFASEKNKEITISEL